ncbi:hypothetical protein [Arthrobacter echini]|uniref:hypothetical protein n=1 Tax=Arthrobacter echini TaxID=1529066 RepID=UPI001455F0FA|nr:hypothetical protein [Arthrobacter echini]
MALDGFSFGIVFLVWIIPLVIGALVLYVVVRFGVKHGMRSYYAEAAGRYGPGPGE